MVDIFVLLYILSVISLACIKYDVIVLKSHMLYGKICINLCKKSWPIKDVHSSSYKNE